MKKQRTERNWGVKKKRRKKNVSTMKTVTSGYNKNDRRTGIVRMKRIEKENMFIALDEKKKRKKSVT